MYLCVESMILQRGAQRGHILPGHVEALAGGRRGVRRIADQHRVALHP